MILVKNCVWTTRESIQVTGCRVQGAGASLSRVGFGWKSSFFLFDQGWVLTLINMILLGLRVASIFLVNRAYDAHVFDSAVEVVFRFDSEVDGGTKL